MPHLVFLISSWWFSCAFFPPSLNESLGSFYGLKCFLSLLCGVKLEYTKEQQGDLILNSILIQKP